MTFKPGQSGNPAGRPRGARNKRTLIAEQALDEHAGEVTQAVIDRAKNGDPTSQRICMDRIAPPLRHRLPDFDLPELKTAADALVASSAIIQGAARGALTVAEANGLMRLVRGFIAVLAVAELEQRIVRLEAQVGTDAARTPEDDDADDDAHDDDAHDDDADDDDAPFIPAQCPPQGADEATTPQPTTHRSTQETNHDDHDQFFASPRPRPREHTDDHAAHAAQQRRGCGDLREASRRHPGERAPDRHPRGDVGARRGRPLLGDRTAAPL